MAFCLNCPGADPVNATVVEADLAPMVDASAVSPSFADVPSGAFAGNGSRFDDGAPAGGGAGARVAWLGDVLAQGAAAGCANARVAAWAGARDVAVPNGDGAALVYVAPVFGGAGLALLGELGKVAAVSTYRFASVALAADGGALEVALRGAPGETVALAFAARDGDEYACRAVNATVGDDGTASVTFSG